MRKMIVFGALIMVLGLFVVVAGCSTGSDLDGLTGVTEAEEPSASGVNFVDSSSRICENAGMLRIKISAKQVVDYDRTFAVTDCVGNDNSATPDVDYSIPDRNVIVPAGSETGGLVVYIVDDDESEETEVIDLQIVDNRMITFGEMNHQIAIEDNDELESEINLQYQVDWTKTVDSISGFPGLHIDFRSAETIVSLLEPGDYEVKRYSAIDGNPVYPNVGNTGVIDIAMQNNSGFFLKSSGLVDVSTGQAFSTTYEPLALWYSGRYVFVLSTENGRNWTVERLDLQDETWQIWPIDNSGVFNGPTSIAENNGNIYISFFDSNLVAVFTSDMKLASTITCWQPHDLCFELTADSILPSAHYLYIVCSGYEYEEQTRGYDRNGFRVYDTQNNNLCIGGFMEIPTMWPDGINVDHEGNVYISDRQNNIIRKLSPVEATE